MGPDGPTLPGPTLPISPSGISAEIEKLFPSVTLEFVTLDTARLAGTLRVASFWGEGADWSYVRAPVDWPRQREFRNVKFGAGRNESDLHAGGGIGSAMISWWSNALLRVGLGDSSMEIRTAFRAIPFAWSYEDLFDAQNDIKGQLAMLIDVVLPLGTTFALPLIASTIVLEKELKLRALLVMMGLQMRYYWLSEWIWNTCLLLVISVLFMFAGFYAELEFVVRSPAVFATLLLLWSQCLLALAMLISCFVGRMIASNVACYLALVFLVLCSLVLNQYLIDDFNQMPSVLLVIGPLAYYRGVHLLLERAYVFGYVSGEMLSILLMIVVDTLVYFAAAFYFDAVLPREFGIVRHPLFCAQPLTRLSHRRRAAPISSTDNSAGVDDGGDEDSDVRAMREVAERAAAAAAGVSSTSEMPKLGICTVGLHKKYDGAGGKIAVHDLSLVVYEDECFGLLGPNGAGKTTTISMWTGLYPPTAGHCTICGHDLLTEMSTINQLMGVCPQFDILWPSLEIFETLRFYAMLKGVPKAEWHGEAMDSAASVDLTHVIFRTVGKLSGGMKRRVSLAISLVGNPKCVFLDEPTTGLDPQTKRAMWTLIDSFKQGGRCIVLTTHSMEEADALCGRIGIMAHGKLRCVGSSLHLKSKHGDGFKLQAAYAQQSREAAIAFLESVVPTGTLIEDFAGICVYRVPQSDVVLSDLFAKMERHADASIMDWAVRCGSLEEVFLSIARKADRTESG